MTQAREELRVPGLAAPLSHYTDAVRAGGLLFVSGMPALDGDGNLVGPGDVVAQFGQVLANLRAVLDAAGALAGIITDGDLRRHMDRDLLGRAARDVMTAGPKTIGPEQFAAEALAIMNAHKITTLFVLETGDPSHRPGGIVHIHDCLRAGLR